MSCTEGGGYNFETHAGLKDHLNFSVYAQSEGYKFPGILLSDLTPGWHMFTGTYDQENAKLYVDGKLISTSSTSEKRMITYANNNVLIGAEATGVADEYGGAQFYGKIKDLSIYATALSQNDISKLYKPEVFIDKSNRIGCSNLNENIKVNLFESINQKIKENSFSGDLSKYTQENINVTIENNECIKIKRNANISTSGNESKTWGGLRIYHNSKLQPKRKYKLTFKMKGYSCKKPLECYFAHEIG
ncbi:LamG-like jellyroll fold domain-containing protein [Paraclostridium dentum]|uniref:LamG-like jellyroll fold domain-containing protein n=1 Tax=Paraclostridium dentum TaxID=2662455 RepID=UPI003F35BDDE